MILNFRFSCIVVVANPHAARARVCACAKKAWRFSSSSTELRSHSLPSRQGNPRTATRNRITAKVKRSSGVNLLRVLRAATQ
uniref:Putative secreted protein n=1 Tax=Anopheles darlingi TaxID=43151 RepID=A0A2M4D434_ANODA